MKIIDCPQCSIAPNQEEVEKEKDLTKLNLLSIAGIFCCEYCGTYYDQWKEEGYKGDDGTRLYRNRLSYVETIFSLEEKGSPKALSMAKRLRLSLSTRMVSIKTNMQLVSPTLQHYFQLNLLHYYHARNDDKALDELAKYANAELQRMMEWHRQDRPIIEL